MLFIVSCATQRLKALGTQDEKLRAAVSTHNGRNWKVSDPVRIKANLDKRFIPQLSLLSLLSLQTLLILVALL